MCKKKIFLILCYLLVIVMMAGTVTWARYKKDIDAAVVIPEAADFQASLVLNDSTAESLIPILTEFKPGETAKDNQKAKKHGLRFTVTNTALPKGGQQGKVSDKPISYTLRLFGKGNIPMSAVLYDVTASTESNPVIYEATTVKRDKEVVYVFEIQSDQGTKEREFSLGTVNPATGDVSSEKDEFILYLGWEELKATNNDDYDDRKYIKEVERLELRATVRGESTGMALPEATPAATKDPVIVVSP